MTGGLVLDMPEATYHSDPALSSTGARRILESPAKFDYLRTHPEPPKKEFDLGTAVHSKVLGVGAPTVAIPEEFLAINGAASTAKAKRFMALARSWGMTPVKADVAEKIDAMAEAVLADAANLFEQEGHPEASMFATDPETGVDMRARFDYLADVAVDLKTTARVATPERWKYIVFDHGYDVQQEWYRRTRELIEGEKRRFVFVAVETEPPYLVGQYELDEQFEGIGARKALKARRVYAECTAAGIWPRRPRRPQLIEPPMPAIYDFQDNYA